MPDNLNQEPRETLGSLIDRLHELRTRRQDLSAQEKELAKEYAALEATIINRLDTEETPTSSGRHASARIQEAEVGTVRDPSALRQYIMDNDALYLLQLRISNGAYRELLQAGESVPGVEPFVKRTLSLRTTS